MSEPRPGGSGFNLSGRNKCSHSQWYQKHRNNAKRRWEPRPPGLKGKEIGLYYKYLNANAPKKDKEKILKLTIPPAVFSIISNNLKSIYKLAEEHKIVLAQTKPINCVSIKEKVLLGDDVTQCTEEHVPKSMYVLPSSSKENNTTYKTINDIKLETHSKGAGDYKYGYDDIITGTFNEKLDECLSKNICISTSKSELNSVNSSLLDTYNLMLESHAYKKMLVFRKQLPAYKKGKELLDVINSNQVVVISGETGCGKSTQVPQIILDNAICNHRGANVRILVTQPRRIAASSLAQRVAEERGEWLGTSVGYAVRLEKVEARLRGSITYCTTGILLADLEVNQALTNYSHIILDEVHERDTHIDLSMCMLKQVLKKRKDLKLILMSATIDSEALSSYFDDCPIEHIEGLAYPVKDLYLEDVLKLTGFRLEGQQDNQRHRPKRLKYKAKKMAAQEMQKDIQYKAEISSWLEPMKNKIDYDIYKTLQNYQIEELNMELILQLLLYICKGEPGAILVFLPGFGDITSLLRKMEDSKAFPSSSYEIHPLHSKLHSIEQHKIFVRPPPNKRKIIIATNIAETSITIDDIVYVIDCGKIKLSGLNIEENISTLKTEWISKANLRQRRGRAGRCQAGVCYHLVTSGRAAQLAERLAPELQRSNLLEPVLAIKRLRLGRAERALAAVPAPPAPATVQWAVKHLQLCGALDETERLTPLGWHLARLPVHPSAGKLLLLGALFGCLDRAASVAAVWGFKDPFLLVIGKERESKFKRRALSLNEPSDHVAMSEAVIQWERCGSDRDRRTFAYENFLSHSTLELLTDMKRQLGDNLRQMGFLASGDVRAAWENRNSDNLSLFKAIVAAALYPNVASCRWLTRKRNSLNQRQSVLTYTAEDGKITLHPSSVMVKAHNSIPDRNYEPGPNWLVYWLKQRSSDLFLIDVTLVYTLPLLFFGELPPPRPVEDEAPFDCEILITNVKVRCSKDTADMLFKLRSLLNHVLASKVMASGNRSTQHDEFQDLVLNTVIELITAEDEQVDDLFNEDYFDSD